MGGDDYVIDKNGAWNTSHEALEWYRNALEEQRKRFESLREFAREIMACWPDGGIDGGELQEAAIKHGLLEERMMQGPCCHHCQCEETGIEFPEKCYFLAEWFTDD
jgi:hypothetical protein